MWAGEEDEEPVRKRSKCILTFALFSQAGGRGARNDVVALNAVWQQALTLRNQQGLFLLDKQGSY